MIDIRLIRSEETLEMRARLMKPFATPEQCRNPGDDDVTSFHLGAFAENVLVGIASFTQEPHPFFREARLPYRLRGMASETHLRRRGLGRQLVGSGEQILRERGGDLLWFNARSSAFLFYEALGFHAVGDLFDIPLIGPHKVMYKEWPRR